MNQYQYFSLLSEHQIENIYKNRARQIGKYFALWSESSHLNKFMVTLSPTINTLDATMELRRNFFQKLNNIKHYKGFKVAYYSAIEIGLNKNPPSKSAQITEQRRMQLIQKNFHIHIQLLTTMEKSDIQTVINRMDHTLFYFHYITTPTLKSVKYDYVIKDVKKINWELQYILKIQYKRKIIYTSSRKKIANYIITMIWGYLKKTYKDKWTENIKDKYSFVLGLKRSGDLVLSSTNRVMSKNMSSYDMLNKKNHRVYIKKNIL